MPDPVCTAEIRLGSPARRGKLGFRDDGVNGAIDPARGHGAVDQATRWWEGGVALPRGLRAGGTVGTAERDGRGETLYTVLGELCRERS